MLIKHDMMVQFYQFDGLRFIRSMIVIYAYCYCTTIVLFFSKKTKNGLFSEFLFVPNNTLINLLDAYYSPVEQKPKCAFPE